MPKKSSNCCEFLSSASLQGSKTTFGQSPVDELKESEILSVNVCVRTSKYFEQDHRRVKQRAYPMLGFKRFEHAAVTISGIELAHKIKKEQFDISTVEQTGVGAQEFWAAALAL